MHDLCDKAWSAFASQHNFHACVGLTGHPGLHACSCGEVASQWVATHVSLEMVEGDEEDDEAERLRLRELLLLQEQESD